MMVFELGTKRVLALAAALACAGAAHAQTAAPDRAGALKALLDCRAMLGPEERLLCFDAAVDAIAQAEAKGDIVVVDREQAAAVRRQAFGFTLPSLALFERGEGEKTQKLDRIAAQVRSAHEDGAGRWVVELEDGAVWRQTDNTPLARRPRPGSTAEIRSAAMGGFFMNLDGQRAVRAQRVK